ncbi:MAG: hypothetical protein RBS43_03265 [Candidatus Cloacimonas sp.]|jgi:predicted metalloprotease with PDZ domain|nr:hypothetical protein [Candidatus Cloacimonas sp.]
MRKPLIVAFILSAMLFVAFAASASEVKDETLVNFVVSPNPMDKQCTISISFKEAVNISLQIQTDGGEVIKDLYSGYVSKNLNVDWDRLDKRGLYVAEGKYVVVVSYDVRYTSTKKTLILK